MPTELLASRPTPPRHVGEQTVAPDPPRTANARSRRWAPRLMGLLALAGATSLAFELRHMLVDDELGEIGTRLAPEHLAIAVGWVAVSLVAAAYNLTGFSAVRVRLRDSLLVQLGISGLRVVTPTALSTPLIAARFLVRNGASVSDATATVALAQIVQLLATIGIVAMLAGVSNVAAPQQMPGPTSVVVVSISAAAIVIVAGLLARYNRPVREAVGRLRTSVVGLVRHARRHPTRMVCAVAASAVLTIAHLMAFAACVAAVGAHLPLLTLAAIYLGAATAGSLLPTPGGIGPVEAALIGGLTAAGIALPLSTAAALLSRLVAVWLPAVPGWWAVVRLRRAAQL